LLEDLLGNLVDNALHYTPPGGHITVRCGAHDGATFLEVEDDGPGIPEAERSRVRERFYRMPGSTGHGCGLGLAIVDEISRLHAANLTIDSGTNGRGTRIRVAFPGTGSENHVAIRRSAMPYGDSPSATRKLASLQSAPVNGNSTVSQTADQTLTLPRLAAARGARGYSLIELIVVMTIVGIVIGIAVPSYKYVTNSNRVSGEINTLLGDLQYARSEAVREGAFVTVCPSTNPTSTTPTCATSTTNWATGWVVFSDLNGNGAFDTGDAVLRAQPAFTSTDTLVAGSTNALVFNREGFILSTIIGTGSGANDTFKLNVAAPRNNVDWQRCLVVGYVGNMVTQRGTTTSNQTCSFP
jgi:prepilin-type N-terminal cleavage/methylation domain-containing protein